VPRREYGAPEQVEATSLADHLEVITKAVFQAGMSWDVVEGKWNGFREAFDGFDPEKVADLTPDDVERLAGDTRIIRNRRKIQATVDNAESMLDLERSGGYEDWLDSRGDFLETVSALGKRFSFLGGFGAYYYLHVVKRPVPEHEEARALLEKRRK
jgi:3-methyladenine DNA glycosylase Tag